MEWLSDEPGTPGSCLKNSDQSACPRIYCCAVLVDRTCGKRLAFFNTHTDHRGENARLFECAMLLDRIKACGFPFVLTGDFNARPDSEPIRLLLSAKEMGITDTTAQIAGTFHGFSMERITGGTMSKIDYIFTNMENDPIRTYAIADDNACGHFYSDHNAVCAYVSFDE